MKEYGDYIKEAKRILRNYNKMKVAVLNLTDEIHAQEAVLRDESISAIQYGDDRIRGSAGELTATEAAAERRIKLERHIADMRERRDELERKIRAIDRALACLPLEEESLVRKRYIDGCEWQYVAHSTGYTKKWAQERGSKALCDVALMLFGVMEGVEHIKLDFEM